MPLMDEFKEEREAIKNASFKERFSYFWCYYKWHVIGTIIAIAVVGSFVYQYITHKENAFYVVVLNSYAYPSAQDYTDNLAEIFELDTSKEQVLFDTSVYVDFKSNDQRTMTSAQKIIVYMASNELDLMISDTKSLEYYLYNDTFLDLTTVLTPEQVEKYKDRFYYIDKELLIALKDQATDKLFSMDFPENPYDPDSITDPVPVGLNVSDQKDFLDNYGFQSTDLIMCPVANTLNIEKIQKYVDYVFSN